MSRTLTQCLIFCKFCMVKAYVILPKVFIEKHPDLVRRLFHDRGIHIMDDTMSRISGVGLFDDILELFLDENQTSAEQPEVLTVASYQPESDILLQLFSPINIRTGKKRDEDTVQRAIDGSNSKVFQILLQYWFGKSLRNDDGWFYNTRLLHCAAYRGQDILVHLLLIHGADIHIRTTSGSTPLHLAAEQGFCKVVKLLLEKGADIDAKDNNGGTPLFMTRHAEVGELLIQEGADVNARNRFKLTPLHRAVDVGTLPYIQLLIEKGADMEAKDVDGATPLLKASAEGLQILIQKGADVHARNRRGVTALHLAVKKDTPSIIRLLIASDAKINVKDEAGFTALHSTRSLEAAEILLENGADIHAETNRGDTPLHTACKTNYDSLVRLLIERGAVVDARNTYGRTPLHHVCCPKIAGILLQNGADVNAVDSDGNPRIFQVCERMSVVEELLNNGARVNFKGGYQSVLLAVASRESSVPNFEIFSYLLERCYVNPTLLKESSIYSKRLDEHGLKRILDRHLVRIRSLNIPHHNFDGLEVKKKASALLKDVCEAEVTRLKSQTLCDTVTLYDVLTRNEYQVACLLRNDPLAETLETTLCDNTFKRQFPMYGKILTFHVRKGKLRKSIQEDGIQIFNSLYPHLFDEISEVILRYLSTEDLFALKAAFARRPTT